VKGSKIIFSTAAAAAVLAAAVYGAPGEDRSGEVIDRVVAVVEDKAILQSEFDMEYQRILMQQQKESLPPAEEREKRLEVMDALVANLLLSIHAEKTGIEVPEAEVDGEVERAVEENMQALGGEGAFIKELEKAGITLEQLKAMWKEKVRSMRLVDGLLRTEIRGSEQVTDNEIRDYYRANLDQLEKRPETISLAQILVLMRAPESADLKARERIAAIEKVLAEGADFAETAKAMSDGPSAQFGGNLGYIKLEDLENPQFEEAVRGLFVGQVSGPVLTEHGYHLIKLEEVRGDEVRLRHILVQREIDEATTEAFAEGIRRQIIDGADFGEMALLYSEDWSSKENGGLVGEVELTKLPDFFLEAIKDLADGQIAPLIREPKGFRIIKVLGHAEERPYTLDEARDGLRELIERRKLQEKYDGYVESLKKIYHVDVKITI
jgi:peptidyl-prolyl cis-trans isomerase SurA